MPRAVDLQLFALALVAGAGVGWLAVHRSRRHRIGAVAILVALLVAWVADQWVVHALPSDVVEGRWPWVAGALVALGAARGATRLPTTPTLGVPPVVPLVLATLVGVWAGVPETSVAILVAGVVGGVGLALRSTTGTLARHGAAVIGILPIGAAVSGAVGDRHALVGGLLCSATLVLLAAGRRIAFVPVRSLVVATALQLAASLVAARQIGVVRDGDDGAALGAGIVVLGLSVLAAAALRRHRRAAP